MGDCPLNKSNGAPLNRQLNQFYSLVRSRKLPASYLQTCALPPQAPISAGTLAVTASLIWTCRLHTFAATRLPSPGRQRQKVLTVSSRPDCFANKSHHWLRKQLATGFELLRGNDGLLWRHESWN